MGLVQLKHCATDICVLLIVHTYVPVLEVYSSWLQESASVYACLSVKGLQAHV